MFSVYGRSKVLAKKTVGKQLLTTLSDISKQMEKLNLITQDQKQMFIDKYTDNLFKTMKPKRCTHEFSTPEIMELAFSIMIKDKFNFSDLVRMKKQEKKNKQGNPVKSKATGKIMLEWVTFN